MSYEIQLTIPEDSSGGHLLSSLTGQQHITPSQAVEQIINHVALRGYAYTLHSPHEEIPLELVGRPRSRKIGRGAAASYPLKTPTHPEAFFGMMSGDEDFSKALDEVIAGRPKLFGF